MAHADKCPVCDGAGVVDGDLDRGCHGCYGKGWVVVDVDGESAQIDDRPVSDYDRNELARIQLKSGAARARAEERTIGATAQAHIRRAMARGDGLC